jgi:transglutaminase-like putative cysteine protease
MEHRFLRLIAITVIFFFSWTFLGIYNLAYAIDKQISRSSLTTNQPKEPKPEEKLQRDIEDITQTIERVKKVKTHEELQGEKDSLRAKRQEIEGHDAEIRKQFADTEEKIKNLPDEIKQRHKDFIKKYEENLNILKRNLDDIEKAETSEEVKVEVEKVKTFLEKVRPPTRHIPLDPNKLPHRKAEPTKKKPRTKEQGQGSWDKGQEKPILVASIGDLQGLLTNAATQALPPPTQADLSETIEIQFTQEIRDLATQLQNNPVKIYEWVRNNIEFVPTYGSIQGANMCLQTKQCNAFDTASLLIALLRTSNIPAKYVYGTIEVPIDKVMNWVGGFTDANSALSLIASGGIPVNGLISGGKLSAAQMEHVWVEAWVDYIPSRGAVHKQGDTWIPLDASFKQHTFIAGIDFKSIANFNASAFLNQVQSSAIIDSVTGSLTGANPTIIHTQLIDIQNKLNNFVAANIPNARVRDVIGGSVIIKQEIPFLPATLPYHAIKIGQRISTIPDALRHKLTFEFPELAGSNITVTKSLPELTGKRLTLSFGAASDTDGTTLDGFVADRMIKIPAYLVQVRPELRLDRELIISGNALQMGKTQTFVMTFFAPGIGLNRISNEIIAGTYNAIVLDLGRVTPEQVNKVAAEIKTLQTKFEARDATGLIKDDTLGALLYAIGISYWAQVDDLDLVNAQISKIVSSRLPSEGIYSVDLSVSFLFGAPFQVSPSGFGTDIDASVQLAVAKDGDQSKVVEYMRQSGVYGSFWESAIYKAFHHPDQGISVGEGITAVQLLAKANELGIPIYQIDKNNIDNILPRLQISSTVKTDIQNAVAIGRTVIIPEREMTIDQFTGIGYIIDDPLTGSGAYLISGGTNGGLILIILGLILVAGALFLWSTLGLAAFAIYGLLLFFLFEGLYLIGLGLSLITGNPFWETAALKAIVFIMAQILSFGGATVLAWILRILSWIDTLIRYLTSYRRKEKENYFAHLPATIPIKI